MLLEVMGIYVIGDERGGFQVVSRVQLVHFRQGITYLFLSSTQSDHISQDKTARLTVCAHIAPELFSPAKDQHKSGHAEPGTHRFHTAIPQFPRPI